MSKLPPPPNKPPPNLPPPPVRAPLAPPIPNAPPSRNSNAAPPIPTLPPNRSITSQNNLISAPLILTIPISPAIPTDHNIPPTKPLNSPPLPTPSRPPPPKPVSSMPPHIPQLPNHPPNVHSQNQSQVPLLPSNLLQQLADRNSESNASLPVPSRPPPQVPNKSPPQIPPHSSAMLNAEIQKKGLEREDKSAKEHKSSEIAPIPSHVIPSLERVYSTRESRDSPPISPRKIHISESECDGRFKFPLDLPPPPRIASISKNYISEDSSFFKIPTLPFSLTRGIKLLNGTPRQSRENSNHVHNKSNSQVILQPAPFTNASSPIAPVVPNNIPPPPTKSDVSPITVPLPPSKPLVPAKPSSPTSIPLPPYKSSSPTNIPLPPYRPTATAVPAISTAFKSPPPAEPRMIGGSGIPIARQPSRSPPSSKPDFSDTSKAAVVTTMPPNPRPAIPLQLPSTNINSSLSSITSHNLSQSIVSSMAKVSSPSPFSQKSSSSPTRESIESSLSENKAKMQEAIAGQRFELCAALRDTIVALEVELKNLIIAEEEARKKAEEEARIKAEKEARIKSEEVARSKAFELARIKAEEEATRVRAEEEARRIAEEEACRIAEEAARVILTLDLIAIADYKSRLDIALNNCIAAYKFEKCVGYRDRKQELVNLENEFLAAASKEIKLIIIARAQTLISESIDD